MGAKIDQVEHHWDLKMLDDCFTSLELETTALVDDEMVVITSSLDSVNCKVSIAKAVLKEKNIENLMRMAHVETNNNKIEVSVEAYNKFNKWVDRILEDNPNLKGLLRASSPWDE